MSQEPNDETVIVDLQKLKEKYANPHLIPKLNVDPSELLLEEDKINGEALKIKYKKLQSSNPLTNSSNKENKKLKMTGRRFFEKDKSKIDLDENTNNSKIMTNSPKTLKNKFKECSSQMSLNSFFQVKTPSKAEEHKEDVVNIISDEVVSSAQKECEIVSDSVNASFKISTNIFMSPRCKNKYKKSVSKKINSKNEENIEADSKTAIILVSTEVINETPSEDVQNYDKCAPNTSLDDFDLNGPTIPVKEVKKSERNIKEPKKSVSITSDETSSETMENLSTETVMNSVDNPGIEKETTKQDVFKLLMNGRTKVIGSNSPGKEKPLENEFVPNETISKEKLKDQKQRLSEWSETFTANKRKLDEIRDKQIKTIIDSRAKRLKEMLDIQTDNSEDVLENKDLKTKSRKSRIMIQSDDSSDSSDDKSEKNENHCEDIVVIEENVKKVSPVKSQSDLLNFLGVDKRNSIKENTENIVKGTTKKLRLSLKKSETVNNSYESIQLSQKVAIEKDEEKNQKAVKKLRGRPRKKLEKAISEDENSLHNNSKDEVIQHIIESVKSVESTKLNETKNNENEIVVESKIQSNNQTVDLDLNEESIDKPEEIKEKSSEASEGVVLEETNKQSSEEVLIEETNKQPLEEVVVEETNKSDERVLRRSTRVRHEHMKLSKQKDSQNKKVAPVFNKALPKVKAKVNPEVLAARNEFLHSGIPSQLKRTFEKITTSCDQHYTEIFPKISHVLQKCSSEMWNLPKTIIKFPLLISPEEKSPLSPISSIKTDQIRFGTLTKSNKDDFEGGIKFKQPQHLLDETLRENLRKIKDENVDYPVYKCFRTLQECNGIIYKQITNEEKNEEKESPSQKNAKKKKSKKMKKRKSRDSKDVKDLQLVTETPKTEKFSMWTEKYQPKLSSSIIGNQRVVQKLQDWLENWLKHCETEEFQRKTENKKRKRENSESEFESEDSGRDSAMKIPGNTLIIRGPSGSGKTTAVYAVCQQLGINVLELNASSRRTGKRLLQELQEATQSHQVRRTNNNLLNNFLKKNPEEQKPEEQKQKEEKNSKTTTEEKNKMCLLLVEDIDVVFEQDDGFVSALNQLILTSKRPIVLIANDVGAPHLQKLITQHPILNFKALSAVTMSTFLQILCLVEGLLVDKDSLGQMIEYNKGDIRRTILQLQFWVQSGGDCVENFNDEMLKLKPFEYRLQKFEETYVDEDDFLHNSIAFDVNSQMTPVYEKNEELDNRTHKYCISAFIESGSSEEFQFPTPVSLPTIWWNLPEVLETKPREKIDKTRDESLNELKKYFNVLESISFADHLFHEEGVDFGLEPTPKYWEEDLKDTLSTELSQYDYKTDRVFVQDVSHTLIENSCKLFIDKSMDGGATFNMAVPVSENRKWRAKQHDCECSFQDAMLYGVILDRKSFSGDYYPYLRHMARMESKRHSNNRKRGNRFSNYLQTINIDARNKTLMKCACNILQF